MTVTLSELIAKLGGPIITALLWLVIAVDVTLVGAACVNGHAVGVAGQVVAGIAAIAAALALVWRRVRSRM